MSNLMIADRRFRPPTIFFAEKLARRNVSCTGNPEMVADYATRLEVFIHEMKAIRPELMPLDGLYNHVMCQISHLDRLVLKMKSYLN